MGTTLHTLKPNPGATRNRKRLGRGHGSGLHKTSGKGQKGQKSRTGHHGIPKPGFEGGQTAMARRLPKRGFKNRFRKELFPINLGDLVTRFAAGELVDIASLKERGLVPRSTKLVKVLAGGLDTEPRKALPALTVKAHAFSAEAKAKIEAVKGTAEALGVPQPKTPPRPERRKPAGVAKKK